MLLVASFLGCDNETTGPKQTKQTNVDPIDWDGDKEDWGGTGPGGTVAAAPSREADSPVLDAGDHLLQPGLSAHDHTIIIEAIMANVQEIAARLPQNQVSSEMEVLRAALDVPAIDRYTKGRIRMVLHILADLEEAEGLVPDGTRRVVVDVLDRLEAYPSVPEKVDALQQMIDSGQYEVYDGLPEGLAAGIEILRDGEKTVYAPRCLLNLKRMLRQDLAGAIGGAIGGAIVGAAPGAGVGALAGSAGASGADAIGQLTGWW
jgi:hypothetical protein